MNYYEGIPRPNEPEQELSPSEDLILNGNYPEEDDESATTSLIREEMAEFYRQQERNNS